jgi:hypothetical protein
MMSSWINPRFGGLVLPALSSFLDVEVHLPFHRHVAEVCSYVAGKALDDWGGDGGDPAVERVFHFSWNPFSAEGVWPRYRPIGGTTTTLRTPFSMGQVQKD